MYANHSPAAFITGLFETHLRVKNLERSAEFYEKTLGLELGMKEQERRVAFYWIGVQSKTMLGLWENPPWVSQGNTEDRITTQHFAFEIAASIYFNDPDGHLLEFIAKLPGKAKPEIGVVSLDEWNRLNQFGN